VNIVKEHTSSIFRVVPPKYMYTAKVLHGTTLKSAIYVHIAVKNAVQGFHCKVLVGKPEGKRPLGRPRRR
jgi:hypothetical protein